MPLKFFNTLSRKTELFTPIQPGKAGLYTCGPTVYHYAHIGNLRTYLFEDLLRRTLEKSGYDVDHVCNITDVGHLTSDSDTGEDKMEKGAAREGKSVWDIAQFYTDAFMRDIKLLNIVEPKRWCKATDHIPEQIAMVQALIDKGYGYQADDGIYYDTAKFPSYGDFARKDLKGQEAGARVACAGGKRNNEDFALWKFSPKNEKRQMEWAAPFGKGFPGWHIECSAMSTKYLGTHFDIHCGGIDHIPVHHTNEIAQTEAATGRAPWVNVWMHGEFLIMDKGKMSKSSGEFLTLQSLIEKGYEPLDYRFLCMQAHYRQGLTFTFEALDGARRGRKNLSERLSHLPTFTKTTYEDAIRHPYWKEFWEAISNDLNSPQALAKVWELARDIKIEVDLKAALVKRMDEILGLDLLRQAAGTVHASAEELQMLANRIIARSQKNWSESDRLRQELKKCGIVVMDGKNGEQDWKRE